MPPCWEGSSRAPWRKPKPPGVARNQRATLDIGARMGIDNPSDEVIRNVLVDARRIAVVGASSNPERPSYAVMRRLVAAGYDVVPVNPREVEVLGRRAVPSLSQVEGTIDIVDVFRRAEHTPALADEAVAVRAKVLWLQQGIVNDEAARRAIAGGLVVVMDACIAVLHSALVPRG